MFEFFINFFWIWIVDEEINLKYHFVSLKNSTKTKSKPSNEVPDMIPTTLYFLSLNTNFTQYY